MQLMILDPNCTVQPETTFTLSHKWAICDKATCICTLIQLRDQISSFFQKRRNFDPPGSSNITLSRTGLIVQITKLKSCCTLASFPGSCVGEEEREPGTHCSHMCQVPLVTCIILRYTKITANSVYLLKGSTAWLYSLWDSYGQFLSQKQYRFDGNCLNCFVWSDRWTSKEDIASVTCCSV